jgi:alpha-D-ribose 1-methylphosphonate 5-triphosphate synthase subunit PhnL
MRPNILQVKGLTKTFFLHEQRQEVRSCRNVHFVVPNGEFVGIVGRSGSGKSTILRCVYRTYLPLEGEIIYDSELFGVVDLARASEQQILALRRQEIGYVSQFLSVMPRTTAREHVESALLEIGADSASACRLTEEMLTYFQLPEELWNLYPNTFSGGERLRLNLAHAMVKEPRLLMLDEPTASLDDETKELVRQLLLKMKRKRINMLGIFHDLAFMDGVCDIVYDLNNGVCGPAGSVQYSA